MKCECVRCGACGGSGTVFFSFSGRYLGNRRCDDLDELEVCDECGGSGVTEVCYECQLAYELDIENAAHQSGPGGGA